ncbi:hypothetical protein ACSF44_005552, partial [Escherichia coli]
CLKTFPVAYLLSPYPHNLIFATLQLIIVTGSVFVKSHQARWVLFDCSLLFLVLSGGFSLTPNLT